MTGIFIFLLFFIQYIFFTPAIGVYVTNDFWLSKALKWISPFQRIESQYEQVFTKNTLSVIFVTVLAVILVISLLINLKVRVNQDEDEQDL